MPRIQQPIQRCDTGGIVAACHTRRLHQRTATGICFQTALSSAPAHRTIQRDRGVTDFAGEPVRSCHYLAVTHNGSADADIAGQINKGVSAVHGIEEIRTGACIAGDLRDSRHLCLIAGMHVAATHNLELHQIDIFPTKIACHKQLLLGRDQARQRTSDTGNSAPLALELALHSRDHGVESVEHILRGNAAHIGIHPLVRERIAIDIQRHTAVAVGINLHADAAHLAATQRERRGRTPIAGRVLRLAFLDDARFNQQRHQQRHRCLGQTGLLGESGPAHRRGGAQ